MKSGTSEYFDLHFWIRKNYGKADHCENNECTHISKSYEWALKRGFNYEYNINNFHQLCISCHRKYDAHLNTNRNTWTTINYRKKGTHLSKEHKESISRTLNKRRHTYEGYDKSMHHNPKAKRVLVLDKNNKIIDSHLCAKEIHIKFGINYSTIKYRLKTQTLTINNNKYIYEIDFEKNLLRK